MRNNKKKFGVESMATTKTPAGERSLKSISELPQYKELIAKRTRFGWVLTVIMLLAYYGYIALVAFDQGFLAQPIGLVRISLGIPVGIGLILFTILITWIYVARANSEFDRLTEEIVKEAGQ